MVGAQDIYVDMWDLASQAAKSGMEPFTRFVKKDFTFSAHHKLVADHLDALDRFDIEKLALLEPPGHGKSTQGSHLFPAFRMAKRPNTEVVLSTYGYDLALEHGRKCKAIIDSDQYRFLFPWAKMSGDSSSNSRFHLTNGSSFFGGGIGGSLTGMRFDTGVIDDPIKNLSQALNPNYQKQLRDWYRTVFYTRRKKRARILLIQTLWSENDLGMSLPLSEPGWTVLKMPAINAENQALWPDMFPLEELIKIKESIGSRAFEALYQQNPSPLEGNIIKRDWIRVVPLSAVPPVGRQIISVDTAIHAQEHNDFSSFQLWHWQGRDRYLVDRIKGRWEFPELIFQFKNFCEKHKNAGLKLVEDTANGGALASHCRDVSGIKLIKPLKEKATRLIQCAPLFEARNVHIVDADFTEEVIEEIVSFPNGRHDDDVDSATQFLNYSLQQGSGRIISVA